MAFIEGQKLLASDLNQIVNSIIQKITSGPGINVKPFGSAIVISLQTRNGRIPPGRVYEVQSDEGDYLICRKLDASGVAGSVDVKVLKPWILRRTPFENLTVNGVAYTYSANGIREADGTETQKITQDYFMGARIVVADQDIVELAGGDLIVAYDTNDSGRAWAVE